MERLRAVVPGAEADPPPTQDFGEVVGMDAVDRETDAAAGRAACGSWLVAIGGLDLFT